MINENNFNNDLELQENISTDINKVDHVPPILNTTIGNTTYKVNLHFSPTATETLLDKVKRMLINDFNKV